MTDTSGYKNEGIATSPTASAIATHFDRARTKSKVGSGDDDDAWLHTALGTDNQNTQQSNQSSTVPQWQHELAASRVGRHSRASSIFSTRTRLTVQSDDARSVEFQAGGQSFRISRDGSKITDVTAPPPYPGRPLDQLMEESDEDTSSIRSHSEEEGEDDRLPSIHSSEATEHQSPTAHSLPLRTHRPPGAISNEDGQDENQRMGTSQVMEFPRRLRNMFSLNWSGTTVTTSNPAESGTAGILRRTHSESSGIYNFQNTSPPIPNHTTKQIKNHQSHQSLPELHTRNGLPQINGIDSQAVFNEDEDDEGRAEISKYYNRVMLDLDRDHRKKLHERDVELSRLRELRNDMDIVYRQQLRDRDNTIEMLNEQLNYRNTTINQLKTQMYELEAGFDRRLEQARHQVEEIWEKRWKEYERLLLTGPDKKTVSRRTSVSQNHVTNYRDDDNDNDNDAAAEHSVHRQDAI